MTTLMNIMSRTETERREQELPPQPSTVEETRLSFLFLVELVTKTLFRSGTMKLLDISAAIKLPVNVLEPVLTFMRSQRLCEMKRSSETETAISYTLSDLGRQRAEEFLRKSQYVGPAPVSLEDYIAQVKRQSIAAMQVTTLKLQEAFQGVIVNESILRQFGAAMNSGRAIFVWGPAGSGKTYIAEHLVGLLSGNVAIPHAINVADEVIQVFDPLIHIPLYSAQSMTPALDRRMATDTRWILCRRPVVKTGGELSLPMLDLEFDESARFYHAPPQVKANNGLLIIDDLGRQLSPAIGIMNRWIVPLDRRVDYLALHTGKKFTVPFDMIVVFSSNLTPAKLADEAFLRRLGYKIFVGHLDPERYTAIAKQVCVELGIRASQEELDYLLKKHQIQEKPLLACIPRDILSQIRDLSIFEEEQPELSRTRLDWAWNNYFWSEQQSQRSQSERNAR